MRSAERLTASPPTHSSPTQYPSQVLAASRRSSSARAPGSRSSLHLPQLPLDLLDAWQARLQILRQRLDELVLRDAHWLVRVAQRVLRHDAILALAQEQPDGRRVFGRFHLRVYGAQVEAQLSSVLGLEATGLD